MSKIVLLTLLSLSFVFSSCKSDLNKKGDSCKCSYDTYQGDIKIVFLWSPDLKKFTKPYNYKINFKFIPKTKITNKKHKSRIIDTFKFTLSNGKLPQDRFVRKYQLEEQAIYHNARLGFLNNNGKNCEKITYEIEGIDRDDNVDSTTGAITPVDLPNKQKIKIHPKDIQLRKPVLYLYPLSKTKINVKLENSKDIAHSYPKYPKNGWLVDVETDGTIKYNKREYYSLYWEMNTNKNYKFDEGFLVAKEDVIPFLEKSLKKLGFKDKEAQEFIIYWLPKLESNDLNLIKFETVEYNKNQPIEITPKPDTLIRVMMIFKKVNDKNMKIKKQILKNTKRKGFVALEWGGVEL